MDDCESEYMKIRKEKASYYLLVFALAFSDVLKNGNLNLLYFWGIYIIIAQIGNKKFFYKDLVRYFIPFTALPLIYVLFSGGTLNIVRACVYCAKLFLNISLLSYFKHNLWKIHIGKVWRELTYIFALFLLLSLVTYARTPLWRVNDAYNTFSKIRLQFLFSEPSVLGLLSSLLLIFTFITILEDGIKDKNGIMFGILALILILTFSMSGIVYFVIASVFYLFMKILLNRKKIDKRVGIIALVVIVVALIIMTTTNVISNRFTAIVQGSDASFNFRWISSFNSLKEVMENTHNWGLGVGNMNTSQGISALLSSGIEYKYANSFLYVIDENGILGMAYILYIFMSFLYECIKERERDKKIFNIKMTLLLFIFISQVAGGYFTDPLLWCVYGIICAINTDYKMLLVRSRRVLG